ncbi:MAG TPA: fibronectin type III domain-containing protein [Candidatus Limnocylindrales bacterium]|nr:fibronectin type III domain-containing protein [Candidatus Limnocylindrales bacterium]
MPGERRISPPTRAGSAGTRMRARGRLPFLAPLALVAATVMLAGPMLVAAQTAEDPSNVVLVFDVSNSILLSDDGTNVEFADALEGIADRVESAAEDLAVGNAEISFVAFGRQAIIYPNGCDRLALHEDPAAITKLEDCLRDVAAEYRAGRNAPVRDRFNTADTDHVRALREAARLLPNQATRSAVIFFTDGAHDPPGTARDDEDVVAEIAAAFEGQSPLAILPVGLGAGAGAFETELRSLFDAYFRDMEPCEGRASFSWPEVVFEGAEQAGIAVAQALQEVTCSFTFAPPPTAPPPTPTPPPPPGAPLNVQVLSGNESLTVQWLPPETEATPITDYLVRCRPAAGGEFIESSEGVSTETEATVDGLEPGVAYDCEVAATDGIAVGPYAPATGSVVAFGLPLAPGQPRVEPGDASARVSVDPVAGGAPAEEYFFECRDVNGAVAGSAPAQDPSAVVPNLSNGSTFDCVAYAENRIGRSPASVASARFTPCGSFLDCNPLVKWGGLGLIVVATLLALAYIARRYARRNRVWVTAQVDGGENRPLGWGPDIGIRLDRDEGGWFAALRPFEGSEIKAQYRGSSRFLVQSKAGIRDVHQGDPAPVRDEEGSLHELILRRYRQRPKDRVVIPAKPDPKAGELGQRLEGKEPEAPPETDQLVG